MAFAYAVTKSVNVSRSKRIVWGTFTNGADDSGGDIVTSLTYCDFFVPSVNSHLGTETIKHTLSGGTATIVTTEGADGTWFAIGT